MLRFGRFFALLLVAVCGAGNQLASAQPPAPAASSRLVSSRKPDGLILSTGNLYFTSHDAIGAAVWRMAQGEGPDQERILYWEPGAIFGDITFAQVNGAFFGYFFAQRQGQITIRRIPLTGGTATTLATVTDIDIVNTHQNLVTDGVSLFWQDVNSIKKMPIGGGAITVLDPTASNTPTAGIVLRNNQIIYASVSDIRFVPTSGAITTPTVRTIATAQTRVTALFAIANRIFWGEQDGSVRTKSGSVTTTLASSGGGLATSISVDSGVAEAWTLCSSTTCQLSDNAGVNHILMPIGADAFGVSVVASGNVFWGDAAGVHALR
jgi:hypothetical protein